VGLNRSNNTVKAYTNDLAKYFENYDAITESNLQSYIIKNKNLSASSMHRRITAIKVYCKLFNIDINFSIIAKPRLKYREANFITDTAFKEGIQRIRVYKFRKHSRDHVSNLFDMLYNTGLRIDELTHLNKSNIDTETKSLVVIGKGNKERRIPVNDRILFYLDQYFITFLNRTSKSTISFWTKLFFGKEYSPHSFRHGYTTKLINSGAGENIVKKVLGHESFTTTLRYFHNNFEEITDAVNLAIS